MKLSASHQVISGLPPLHKCHGHLHTFFSLQPLWSKYQKSVYRTNGPLVLGFVMTVPFIWNTKDNFMKSQTVLNNNCYHWSYMHSETVFATNYQWSKQWSRSGVCCFLSVCVCVCVCVYVCVCVCVCCCCCCCCCVVVVYFQMKRKRLFSLFTFTDPFLCCLHRYITIFSWRGSCLRI